MLRRKRWTICKVCKPLDDDDAVRFQFSFAYSTQWCNAVDICMIVGMVNFFLSSLSQFHSYLFENRRNLGVSYIIRYDVYFNAIDKCFYNIWKWSRLHSETLNALDHSSSSYNLSRSIGVSAFICFLSNLNAYEKFTWYLCTAAVPAPVCTMYTTNRDIKWALHS